ncbi:MAG: type II toxin-antitoxin system Phd/YefM family antitoxin [Candidatus Marinimicrobia bacterium]|nr:type II toxin-antitoxin system Phd/YefM family antitoxin [Candidatus Neomarinimicrobiota bacterium]
MSTITTVELRKHLAEVVNAAKYRKERLVLTRHNKPVAALVPFEDYQLLEALEDKEDLKAALAALDDAEDELVPWEAVRANL